MEYCFIYLLTSIFFIYLKTSPHLIKICSKSHKKCQQMHKTLIQPMQYQAQLFHIVACLSKASELDSQLHYSHLNSILKFWKQQTIIEMNKLIISCLLLALMMFIGSCDNPDCEIRNSDGSCRQCKNGYNDIQNGTCIKADPNCASIIFSTGACFQCKQGYSPRANSNGKCVNVAKNCKTFEEDGNTCASCYAGYCGKSCTIVDTSCATYTNKCACATCWWGNPIDGVCGNTSNNCKTVTEDGSCASCYAGYCGKKCNIVDTSCKTYTDKCECATCWWGNPIDGDC